MLAKESADFEEGEEDDCDEGDDESIMPATGQPRKSRKVSLDLSDEEAEAPAEDPLEEDEADPSCAKDVLRLDDSSDEEPPANDLVADSSSTPML
jgi:hypothetical protein